MKEIFKQEGYNLIGAAMEVYNQLGSGFLEEIYQECLEIELKLRGIVYESKPKLTIFYKKNKLNKYYQPDLYVYNGIIVELKAIKHLGDNEIAQILNYLKGSEKRVGYLINYGCPTELEWKRFIL